MLVNAGCGPKGSGHVPRLFGGWNQLRIDVDPGVQPDILADITQLTGVPDQTADAIWSAHCIEHLYQHQVPSALGEFHRVLKEDGFICLVVPDLQTIASYIANDKINEVVYTSPAGPITAHDMVFGFGTAIAAGHIHMAHKSGFTPSALIQALQEARFAEFIIRRRPTFELAVVARKTPWPSQAAREALLDQLAL